MAKVKIDSKIKNISTNLEARLECDGILNNNKLIYKDNDSNNEIMILSNEVILTKKRVDNIKMKFYFKENSHNFIEVIDNNYSLKIPLSTEKLIIKENEIEIHYQVDSNEKFLFHLIYKM